MRNDPSILPAELLRQDGRRERDLDRLVEIDELRRTDIVRYRRELLDLEEADILARRS